jgi:hypothetical protein
MLFKLFRVRYGIMPLAAMCVLSGALYACESTTANGGGGAHPTPTPYSDTPVPPTPVPPTPVNANPMANWVHRQDQRFAYWVPTDKWIGSEALTGIDISSPTGDAIVSFAFAYGPLIPTSLEQAESIDFKGAGISSLNIVAQSDATSGPLGSRQTTEFSGVWATTGSAVHGSLIVDLGNQVSEGYLMMASTSVWPNMEQTLQLIRNHITYMGAGQ